MKANELMIGDWVQGYLPDTFSTIVGVLNAGMVAIQAKRAYIELSIDDIQPIPLTAEILEKNGFVGDKEVIQYDFTEDGQKYHFTLRQMYDKDDNPKGYSFFAFNVLTIIDYVHQLQHALKLCGIDKQIVL